MKKRNITLLAYTVLGVLFGAQVFAQTNVNMPYNNGPATFSIAPPGTCYFNFYDNGGPTGNYSNNSTSVNSQVTFAPSAAGSKIRATFTQFSTEASWDALYVYDGNSTAAPKIASANGTPIGGSQFGSGGFWGGVAPTNGAAGVVTATAGNASGALTFGFHSDGSVNSAGWTALVNEFSPAACAMTAPANQNVSTDQTTCDATVTTALPTFNPGGCANDPTLTLSYTVNGGTPVVVPQPLPATITVSGLPKGANVILWQLVTSCGNSLISSATQTITVADLTPPVITCPGNVTLNLSPGECRVSYSYTVDGSDNCPFVGPSGTLNTLNAANNYGSVGGAVHFDVTNLGSDDITVTELGMRISANTIVNVYMKSGTSVGFQTNAGAWTLVATADATSGAVSGAGFGNGTLTPAPTSFVIPPGQWGITLHTPNASQQYTNGNGGNQSYSDGTLQINLGTAQNALWAGVFNPRVWNGYITYQTITNAEFVQTSGLPSGAEFEVGTTTNCFMLTDAAGNTATCCFDVTVNEYPNAISALVCNDLVQVSMDEDCVVELNADQILEGGPYRCYDNYVVELDRVAPYGNGPWTPGILGNADVGHTYGVRVTDPKTGNKCWGNIKIEDKLPPVLDCPNKSLPCNFPSFAPEYSQSLTNYTAKFAASGLPLTLMDFQTVEVQIPVANASGPITDVDFLENMTGDVWFFNIGIEVESPSGTKVTCWNNVGGCNGPLWTRFDDEGSTALACVDYTTGANAFIPFGFGTLSAFDGEDPNGIWKVRFRDNDGFGDISQINEAALFITADYNFTAGFPNKLAYPSEVTKIGNQKYTVIPGAGDPQMENCSATTLEYLDTELAGGCASGFSKTIQRKWTATDASGNFTTCVQLINLTLPTLGDMTLPPDYDGIDNPALSCTGAYPSPDYIEGIGEQGWPHVFDQPDGCTINWTYTDARIDVCDGTYKIARHWTIVDWCAGESVEHTQIIKVVDDQGPSFDCPANMTVSTDAFTCCGTADLPDMIVTDNCSRLASFTAMVIEIDPATGAQGKMHQIPGTFANFAGNNLWEPDTMAVMGLTPCLPMGTHTVIYTVEDDCGNTSTCSFRLTVRDYTPPVAACDEYTVVGIGVDDPFDCYVPSDACNFAGVTWVKATTFDDGSYDNCGDIKFTIRRMAPYSDCILGLNPINGHPECDPNIDPFPDFPSEFERAISEYDSIKFYCCEVGTTQTVILRVYQLDAQGNIVIGLGGEPVYNECMIQVEVQDKIKPVCQSPANVTVSCENFDPSLWAYGKAAVYDNCCLDTSKVYQGQCGLTHSVSYSLFDTVCNKGTITRTFRAFDCHGFSSQCTQRIFVNYEQDYFVKFPNDVIVTVCDGTGNYGEPTIYGEDCELLGISHEDEVFTVVPDACYKIERTWTIINWCTYDPNQGCVNVPNPNPNATVNHPSNLPGPTISATGTPAPWQPTSVKVNSSDPSNTNYSVFYHGGTYTNYATGQQITVPNISAVNCYKYKQIIKVIDTQAPEVQCPASPVDICDLTANDPLLWNASYWYDAKINSHDLCEAPSDICITATDLCSGSNINIRYLLFLDLDGDGSMETVVSSTNLPGYNNVQYGNANNPNFTGGTPRQFDGRPVLPNQKYGFAIQNTVSGNNKTACVRWNTQQSPNSYVVPELPYGTHKIKWIVEDGCGNEKVCEYTFVVKDCKKPTVVCINGLSVNIMPTKMVTLWDTDFLQYTEDNCTPSNLLKTGIRKSGTGTGFPLNPDGTPQKSVTFDCTELGTQLVELWSIDVAGNADYCETYVIVQDNMGNCSNNFGAVAGALKTETDKGLEDATVTLSGSHPALPPAGIFDITDAQGAYNLAGIPLLDDYTVTPNKDNDPLNGVSTFDLVLINKHILGLEPLNTPYKMIAADANNSRSITTFDIVELRKLILGIYTELPNNTSWRFVDKSYTFPNANNPFQTIFPETKQIADMAASMDDENFVSVKVGDVNGNAVTSSLTSSDDRTAGTLLFDVEDRAVKAGETFTVNFKAAEKVQGYQFTMNYNNLELVEIVPGTNMNTDNFGVFASEHALTTSWDGTNQAEFTLTFRAQANGMLSQMLGVSSRITKAEAYNAGAERLQVAFRFNGANGSTITGLGFELYQNTPNPFINKTQIGFYLPEATEATLTIFDESGRMVFTQTGDFGKGYNAVTIDRAVLSTSGVLYYKLETATDSATKKMIQSK